jgi:hypothetical protein
MYQFAFILVEMNLICCREEYLQLRQQCLEVSVFKIKEEESEVFQIGEKSISSDDINTTVSLSSEQANVDPATPELPFDSDMSGNNPDKEVLDDKPTLDLPDTKEEDMSELTNADPSDGESATSKVPKDVDQLNSTASKKQSSLPC